jgi:hypothetical protein
LAQTSNHLEFMRATVEERFGHLPRQPYRGFMREQQAEGELLPVPCEMIPRVWRAVRSAIRAPQKGLGPGYDTDRLHGRLLLGIDCLWVAALTKAQPHHKGLQTRFAGIVITSIGPPPTPRPCKLFYTERSLTVHFIAGVATEAWIADAVQKICDYGKAMGCRQVFAISRSQWTGYYAGKFFDNFERVGIARDRGRYKRLGYFRRLERDLPPHMSFDCARHQSRRIYTRERKALPRLPRERKAT